MQDGINKFCPPPSLVGYRIIPPPSLLWYRKIPTLPTRTTKHRFHAPQPRKMINNNTYKFSLFSVQFFSPMMKKENIEMAVKKTRKK